MDAFHKPDYMWHLEVVSLRINWIIIISTLQIENLNNKEFEDLFKQEFKDSGIGSSSLFSN